MMDWSSLEISRNRWQFFCSALSFCLSIIISYSLKQAFINLQSVAVKLEQKSYKQTLKFSTGFKI